MPIETATYIHDLNPSYPLLSDEVYDGQAHLVLIKSVLQSQFPTLGEAAVTATAIAINTAAAAISGSALTVPQAGTTGASVILPAGTAGTTMTLAARTGTPGLSVVAQGPTVTGITPPPVTELLTNGMGNVAALLSLGAPTLSGGTLSAVSSITKAGYELLPTGVICMWSGSIASIPGGWALCNGANGTPNLIDRFIVGAGNLYVPGATGGATGVSLVTANIPAHTHALTDPGHSHGVADPGHTHAITDPGHTHGVNDPGHNHSTTVVGTGGSPILQPGGGYSVNGASTGGAYTGISLQTGYTGNSNDNSNTGITIGGHTTGITMASVGSGTAFGILPPYYALALIMKL